eukprot:CFRG8233T1
MSPKTPRSKTVTVARRKNRDPLAILRSSSAAALPLTLTKKQAQRLYGEFKDAPSGFADAHEKERLSALVAHPSIGVETKDLLRIEADPPRVRQEGKSIHVNVYFNGSSPRNFTVQGRFTLAKPETNFFKLGIVPFAEELLKNLGLYYTSVAVSAMPALPEHTPYNLSNSGNIFSWSGMETELLTLDKTLYSNPTAEDLTLLCEGKTVSITYRINSIQWKLNPEEPAVYGNFKLTPLLIQLEE